MRRLFFALMALVIFSLACGGTVPRRQLELYPSVTANPTQTPYYIVQTQTPNATFTPLVVVVTQTPNALGVFCVNASTAVYLRPTPNTDNYPIVSIPNGSRVTDLGGRNGNWLFIALGDKRGWINKDYLSPCTK